MIPMRTLGRLATASDLRRGAAAVYAAIFSLVLFGFAGLAIDTANVWTAGNQLQATADASALAAARQIKLDDPSTGFALTRQAAAQIAGLNEVAGDPLQLDPNTDVVVGKWDDQTLAFAPTTNDPNAVMVTARRTSGSPSGPLDLFFGSVWGAPTSDVSRSAVAIAGTNRDPLILTLNHSSNQAVYVQDNASLDATAGTIHVNSLQDCGMQLTGSAVARADTISIVGTACPGSGTIVGHLQEGAASKPDPYSGISDPPFGTIYNAPITAPGTYSPGLYEGIILSSGTVTLEPGNYVLVDKGIELSGTARLEGDGVMIHIRKFGVANQPAIDLRDQAQLRLTPPGLGSAYEGVTIFQDRFSASESFLRDQSQLDCTGAMYLFCGRMNVSGGTNHQIGKLITDRLHMTGNSALEITGKGLLPSSYKVHITL